MRHVTFHEISRASLFKLKRTQNAYHVFSIFFCAFFPSSFSQRVYNVEGNRWIVNIHVQHKVLCQLSNYFHNDLLQHIVVENIMRNNIFHRRIANSRGRMPRLEKLCRIIRVHVFGIEALPSCSFLQKSGQFRILFFRLSFRDKTVDALIVTPSFALIFYCLTLLTTTVRHRFHVEQREWGIYS